MKDMCVAVLNTGIQLLEDKLHKAREPLATALHKLQEAQTAANDSNTGRKGIQNWDKKEEDHMDIHDLQLKDAKHMAKDADRK